MSHFVDDNTDLPDGKVDRAPRIGAEENSVTAVEWNEVMQALKDLRDRVVTLGTQTFGGDKTLNGELAVNGLHAATVTSNGIIQGGSLILEIEEQLVAGDYATEKFNGTCKLASGESEVVVSLPGVRAADAVLAIMAEADATATQIIRAETAVDTITIVANSTATGNPRVNWFLIRSVS